MDVSTHKKLVVWQSRTAIAVTATNTIGPPATQGYARVDGWLQSEHLDVLSPSGQLSTLSRESILAVFFVSEFVDDAGAITALTAERRHSTRMPGLHVRLRGRERFSLDGILASRLLDIAQGATLSPLFSASLWHRAFVPRAAIEQLDVVELVRPSRRRNPTSVARHRPADQFDLFNLHEEGSR